MRQERKRAQYSSSSTTCQAQRGDRSPDPDDAQDEIVLSNWRLPEFWEGLTWEAAVPATCAVAISWVLTDRFIISKLPDVMDARCVLLWLIPTALLDTVVWSTQLQQQQQPGGILTTRITDSQDPAPVLTMPEAGLDLYWRRRRALGSAQQGALPPVQKNVLLFLQNCAHQLAIQGVLSAAAVPLLQEVDREFPGTLPQLAGLPGLAHVDPTLVAAAACTGVMVAMASYRIRCSAHAFHPDHLARSTLSFMASLGAEPATDDTGAGAHWRDQHHWRYAGKKAAPVTSEVESRHVTPVQAQAALAAAREALLLTSCTFVYLQTDSILASVWVAYMAANFERRLASLSEGEG